MAEIFAGHAKVCVRILYLATASEQMFILLAAKHHLTSLLLMHIKAPLGGVLPFSGLSFVRCRALRRIPSRWPSISSPFWYSASKLGEGKKAGERERVRPHPGMHPLELRTLYMASTSMRTVDMQVDTQRWHAYIDLGTILKAHKAPVNSPSNESAFNR